MLTCSFCFLILDLLVCFPLSFRNKCQYKASLNGADDAEEDEEAGVTGKTDDGSGDLNSHEDHEELVTNKDHTDQELEVWIEPLS